jgi:subtilisin family serine protease
MSISLTPSWAQIATESHQGHDAVAGQVLIKFQQAPPDNPQAQAEIAAHIQQAKIDGDIDVARTIGSAGWMLFHSRSKDVATLMSIHTGAPGVLYVEPNWVYRVTNMPTNAGFSQEWGMYNTGQAVNGICCGIPGADIGAVKAWDMSTGSSAILVGILDTGIYYPHPNLAANLWSAPSQFSFWQGSTEYTCPAGTHGWNTFNFTCYPMDNMGHGTNVSGIIGAEGTNQPWGDDPVNYNVAGVNWTTTMIAAEVCTSLACPVSNVIDGLQFMEGVKAGLGGGGGSANIRVLNNSYGGPSFSQALHDEINNTYVADMLFVAAAGNNDIDNDIDPFYPASYSVPNVIAVAATDNQDNLWGSSNYGGTVQLGAPGVGVYTTDCTVDINLEECGAVWGYAWTDGTSMASPFVAGTAALVLSVCAGDTDWLVPDILQGVVQEPSWKDKDNKEIWTGGRLDAYNSLYAASTACPGTGYETVWGGEQHKVIWTSRTSYQIIYDSGTVSLTVNGATKTVSFGQGSTLESVATSLYNQINQDGTYPVRAHLSYWGSTYQYSYLGLTAKTTGPGSCYTVTTSYTYDTVHFKWPSFAINPAGSTLVGCK